MNTEFSSTNGSNNETVQLPEAQDFISKIEKIRQENNRNWTDLMRLAFKHAPGEAITIMKRITGCDEEINRLMKDAFVEGK